uniref:Uncharacterized protein n=1 Tax=Trichobilharzia regenti TaxID=157069 RepID=A0AA85J6U0_TRIRE|nr:unnamed protein product [Trichobilharzia regenti]
MPPLNTAYLQDTRRYLSGSGSLSEKRNHHHQHSQLQQLQTSASPLHSSLQTRKTSIPYTGDANFGYPPSLNSSSLHNSNNNSNIQQYSSRNHPFVPPISYRPATLTTNVNFVSSAQQCNQPTTMTGITTGTTTTTTSATTFDPTSTTTNKSCIVSRRERSSKDHPSELSQAQQYPTAYSSQNNLSSIQSSKAEMNVTSIPASNPVLHKYSPYTPSSQMQNNQMPGVPQPSENHHSSNHHSYYNYPPHHSSVQTLKTPLTNVNTETPIKSTTNVAFTPSNHSSNKTSRKSLDNTEQRRKARELYVALKQRYPSASQNTPTHDEVPTLSSSSQNTPPMIGRDNPTETITDKHYPQQQSEQPPNKSHEQHSDSGLLVKDPISQNNQVKHNETDRDHPETTQKFDSKNTLEGQSQLNIPKDFSGCDQKANSSLISNAATATNTTTYNNSVSSILLTDNKSKHSATLVETIKNLSYQAVSPDDLIRPCGYQSDGGLECMNIFSPTHSSYNSMKQLTSPMSYQTTTTKSPTSTTTNTTNQQQQQQQIDINDKLYNPSNVLISSLPRNLKAPYLNSSLQFINYQAKKKKSDEENNEMLGNYARRMHERLQEGMRAAQESLWIPDLPELNIMNRLNHSDIMKNISSSMNEGNKTTSLSESETDHLSCSNQNDEPKVKMTPMNPNLNLDKMSSPLSISETGHLPHPLNSRVNCYSSLNLGFHLTNTSVNSGGGGNRPQEGSQAITKGFNSQSINNIKVNNNNNSNNDNSNDVHGEYSHWDLKNGVCSDVEDLLNQHERRLLSLSSGTGKIRFPLFVCLFLEVMNTFKLLDFTELLETKDNRSVNSVSSVQRDFGALLKRTGVS